MIAAHPTGTRSTLPARVLVAVDASPSSLQILAYARNLCAQGGTVRLASVAENPITVVPTGRLIGDALSSARAELLQDASDAVDRAKEVFAQRDDLLVETEVIDLSTRGGDIADALIDSAATWHADLLVVGARQHRGLLRWIEGTVSEPLVKRSRCPLLIVPEDVDAKPGRLPARILFALDASRLALNALRQGIGFATSDTYVHGIYVVDRAVRLSDLVPIDVLEDAFIEEGSAALATARAILESVSPRSSTALVNTERTGDDIAHAIVRVADAWHAELIVMGTHGRRAMARWVLGSVALRVARLTHVPLLLVHPQQE